MSELPVFFVAVVDKLLQGNMSGRTGKRMLILVAGAIMAKGRRTVASVLSAVVVKLFVAKIDQLKGVFWALVRAPVCLG